MQYLTSDPDWFDVASMHVMLHEIGSGSAMFDPTRGIDTRCRELEDELHNTFSSTTQILLKSPSRGGVIVSTGGFFFNQAMLNKYAPKYNGYMPLGNMGDDGMGIEMGLEAGCELGQMDRCSAWKFINPPLSFVRGILVNGAGKRVGNEDTYGATFADFLVQEHGGKGWLIIDQDMWDEANWDCMNPESVLQEDQRMQGLANLHKNHKKGDTIEELAQQCDMGDVSVLVNQVNRYNADAKNGDDTEFHKKAQFCVPLMSEGPYYAINLAMVGNKYWPTPSMSLGGIKVEGSTGKAIQQSSGKPISGLYAAGRSCVGIASNYYVSGLSIGDAIFTGRRAGRHCGGL